MLNVVHLNNQSSGNADFCQFPLNEKNTTEAGILEVLEMLLRANSSTRTEGGLVNRGEDILKLSEEYHSGSG